MPGILPVFRSNMYSSTRYRYSEALCSLVGILVTRAVLAEGRGQAKVSDRIAGEGRILVRENAAVVVGRSPRRRPPEQISRQSSPAAGCWAASCVMLAEAQSKVTAGISAYASVLINRALTARQTRRGICDALKRWAALKR